MSRISQPRPGPTSRYASEEARHKPSTKFRLIDSAPPFDSIFQLYISVENDQQHPFCLVDPTRSSEGGWTTWRIQKWIDAVLKATKDDHSNGLAKCLSQLHPYGESMSGFSDAVGGTQLQPLDLPICNSDSCNLGLCSSPGEERKETKGAPPVMLPASRRTGVSKRCVNISDTAVPLPANSRNAVVNQDEDGESQQKKDDDDASADMGDYECHARFLEFTIWQH